MTYAGRSAAVGQTWRWALYRVQRSVCLFNSRRMKREIDGESEEIRGRKKVGLARRSLRVESSSM